MERPSAFSSGEGGFAVRQRRMRRVMLVVTFSVLLIHRKRSPFSAGEGFSVVIKLKEKKNGRI